MILISLLQYAAAFLLGVMISVQLCSIQDIRRNTGKILLICSILLAAQMMTFALFGLSVTKKVYPLLVHFPLWVLLVLLLDVPKPQTAVSVLVAYMCCQVPRWVASGGMLIPEQHWLYQILYLPVAGLFLIFFWRKLASPIRWFMERSQKTCLAMGFVPALYYAFDYLTAVHTDLLLSGNVAAVQFMPSVVSVGYLLFVVIYSSEVEKQMQISRERDFLAVQLNQSRLSFSAIHQLQEKTMQYRHDMRHHFTLLQVLAAENNLAKIQQYLNAAQKDIEGLTPVRYCSNEIVNMLLSYHKTEAENQGVEMTVTAAVPAKLPYSETELCALLSNGLENAVQAAARVQQPADRKVSVHMGIHGENFMVQIENTFSGEIFWQDGLPCTDVEAHGMGTRSIRSIVRSYGGEALFQVRNDRFRIRMMLPTKQEAQHP